MNTPSSMDDYEKKIKELIDADSETKLSGYDEDSALSTEEEQTLNEYMNAQREAMIAGRYIYSAYPPALRFNKAWDDIQDNTVFQTIFSKMPCGGNLHMHTSSTFNTGYFLELLAEYPNVYIYWDPNQGLSESVAPHGKFFYLTSKPEETTQHYYAMSTLKTDYPDIYNGIPELISFVNDRIDSVDYAWDAFNDYFSRVGSILKIREIYVEYYKRALLYQWENGNDYIEIRAGMSSFVENHDMLLVENHEVLLQQEGQAEKNGISEDVPESIVALYEAYSNVKSNYQSLHGEVMDLTLKVILSSVRVKSIAPADALESLKYIPAWKKALKDMTETETGTEFMIGFDLVSEEDVNHETNDYASLIIDTLAQSGETVDFYFHDGESNWADNDNLRSAYALGTKRIGHGTNLYNFPNLLTKLIDDKICLEVCPISNQMLRYILDLRTHPVGQFIKRGVPCVICSDDPQIFETVGTYYDLWEAYYGCLLDLRDIKQLIFNSYKYSGMSDDEKEVKIKRWKEKWEAFVATCVANIPSDGICSFSN